MGDFAMSAMNEQLSPYQSGESDLDIESSVCELEDEEAWRLTEAANPFCLPQLTDNAFCLRPMDYHVLEEFDLPMQSFAADGHPPKNRPKPRLSRRLVSKPLTAFSKIMCKGVSPLLGRVKHSSARRRADTE